ncbi:hypothetical protein DL767_010491 [Monosporascus sp. MG133]|nr:hypothetical protein DL767_010491 [Monosporascus sp. MG133]
MIAEPLQLNSLAVRDVSLSQGRLSTDRKEFAIMVISVTGSILVFLLEEEDIRRALMGTPLYVHTMIAFASVFLTKVAMRWNRKMRLNVESGYVSHLMERMIMLLESSVTSDRHLLYHIAFGLEKMPAKLGFAVNPTPKPAINEMGHEVSPGQDSVISFGPMGYGPSALPKKALQDNVIAATGDGAGWDPYTADGNTECLRRPDISREHNIGRPGHFAVGSPRFHRGIPGAAYPTTIARFILSPSVAMSEDVIPPFAIT